MKTNLFAVLMCLVMGMSVPSLLAADKAAPRETTVVIATGLGLNEEQALSNALRNAVRQVVGVLIDAETLIRNEQVVKEQILDFSPGFVEKYEKTNSLNKGNGLHEVTIKATVKRWQIVERVENLLNTKGYTGKFDGRALWTEIFTKPRGQVGILKKALKDLNLPYSLLKAGPLNLRPRVVKQEAEATQYEWKIWVQYDLERYQKVVLPKLKQVLDGIAMAKMEKPVRHNVKDNKWGIWGRSSVGWDSIGVHDYLFGVLALAAEKIILNPPLPEYPSDMLQRARKLPPANPGQKKPVAGGIPVFLMEEWQPLTGQQTYRVYWVNLECAKVLKEYFSADSALKLNLRDKDKRVVFTKTIHFWGDGAGGVETLGLIGKRELKAKVLHPTLIYGGSSEFIDEKHLVEKMLLEKAAGAEFVYLGRSFRLAPAPGRMSLRQVNTIVIMPLMHLQQSRVTHQHQLSRGVTLAVYHPWQPVIPNAIYKEVREITCEIVKQ